MSSVSRQYRKPCGQYSAAQSSEDPNKPLPHAVTKLQILFKQRDKRLSPDIPPSITGGKYSAKLMGDGFRALTGPSLFVQADFSTRPGAVA